MQAWRAALRPAVRQAARCNKSPVNPVQGAAIHATAKSHQHEFLADITGDGSTVTPALLEGLNKAKDPVIAREIEAYLARNRIRHTTASYGADVAPHYKPNDLISNPPSPSDITVELLLASQTHLGHSTSLWHPANSRYIFGIREGIHIFSPDITAAHLRRAATIVSGVTARGGLVLFAGTRKGHERAVVNAARLAGGYHLFDRWMPGTITNGVQILGRCSTKLVDEFDREIEGFEDQLDTRPVLKPDLIVCFNTIDNYVMLHECGLAAIPTIGIVDSDTNPTWVTYPIPANDDSVRSVAMIAGVLGRAGEEGQQRRMQDAFSGETRFNQPKGINPMVDESNEADAEENSERDQSQQTDEGGAKPAAWRWKRPQALREMSSGVYSAPSMASSGASSTVTDILSNGSAVSPESLRAEDAALLTDDIQDEAAADEAETALNEATAEDVPTSRRNRRAEDAELERERSEVV